jgi:hypothetical protein
MKLTVKQLRQIISEETRRALSESGAPADPATFERVYGLIKRLGGGDIPLEDLLALPAWFDAGADPTDVKMSDAYDKLIETPVTIGHLDDLVAAYHGA